MTIQEALDMADEMKPNMMDRELKIKQLSILDGLIHQEIRMKHVHTREEAVCPDYDRDTDPGTELIVPSPHAEDLYTHWLMSKIDLQNREMDNYNADRTIFENAYDTMSDWWTRTRMPLPAGRYFRV